MCVSRDPKNRARGSPHGLYQGCNKNSPEPAEDKPLHNALGNAKYHAPQNKAIQTESGKSNARGKKPSLVNEKLTF